MAAVACNLRRYGAHTLTGFYSWKYIVQETTLARLRPMLPNRRA